MHGYQLLPYLYFVKIRVFIFSYVPKSFLFITLHMLNGRTLLVAFFYIHIIQKSKDFEHQTKFDVTH